MFENYNIFRCNIKCKIFFDVNFFLIYFCNGCNGMENLLYNVNFLMYRSYVTFGLFNFY